MDQRKNGYDDWMPAFAGMTASSTSTSRFMQQRSLKKALLYKSKKTPTLSCQHAVSWHPVSIEAALDASFRWHDCIEDIGFSIYSITPFKKEGK